MGTLFEDLPAAAAISGTDGLYIVQDGDTVCRTTVAEFIAAAGGGAADFKPPLAADFTVLDSAAVGVTATDTDTGLSVNTKSGNGTGNVTLRGILKAAPSGSTWAIVGRFKLTGLALGYIHHGIALKNTSSGKYTSFGLTATGDGVFKYEFLDWASVTGFDHVITSSFQVNTQCDWFKLAFDGTNLIASISADGKVWLKFATTPMSDFLGSVDHVGIITNNQCDVAIGEFGVNVLYYKDT